jgi:hypothetical protein
MSRSNSNALQSLKNEERLAGQSPQVRNRDPSGIFLVSAFFVCGR